MKILVINTNNYAALIEGWISGLEALGYDVIYHNPSMPIFRTLDQIKPDLLILTIENLNRTVKKAISEFKVKAVCWTDRLPEEYQKSDNIIWVSHDQQLGFIHVPLGYNPKFEKQNEGKKNYDTISMVNCDLTASEESFFRHNRHIKLFSTNKKRIPNYLGQITDRFRAYQNADIIYALGTHLDIGDMMAAGAQVKLSVENDIDWIPPTDSYVNIMQYFIGQIS